MPYKQKICGIYSIISPCGGKYIGGSSHVKQRWSEHRCELKHGRHRSPKLQEAYGKYGLNNLKFCIEEVCDEAVLLDREEFFINACDNLLNESNHPTNVWKTPEIKQKILDTTSTDEYKYKMKVIRAQPKERWVSVYCSDGRTFPSYAHAAREFGVTTTRILMLCQTQRIGNLGVKFKKTEDEWITEYPKRIRKPHSDETRALMKQNRKGWKPSDTAIKASALANSRPVIGTNIITGEQIVFPSQKEAARFVHPNGDSAASCQINRAANGGRKSAFGFSWRYA
jgi:group I intron endonuclease